MAVSTIIDIDKVSNTSVTTGEGTSIRVNLYRSERVVYVAFTSGNYTAAADATLLTIPSGYRPISQADFVDSYSGTNRINIATDGTVSCKTALNNYPVRGTISYICSQ